MPQRKSNRHASPAKTTGLFTSPKATRWALPALTWVAFLLRVATLNTQSLWRDEVDAIRFSSWPLTELATGLFRVGHNGPLFFLLLRFWRNFTGNTEFALRYLPAVWGTLAVPLGFVLARELGFCRRAGWLLSLLLASSPYLVWYGQEAKMYTLLLVLVMAAAIAYLRALAGAGKRWWVVFVLATTLSFYTHILAPLMLAVYSLIALVYLTQWRQQWRGWLASIACVTLPYLPLAWWQAPLLLRGYQSGHPFYSLSEETHLLLQLYSGGLLRTLSLMPIILYVFLLLAGLFLPARPPDTRTRLALAGWTLLPPVLVYLISLRVQVFEDRYLIYITPAFYLLAVAGLLQVRRHARLLAGLSLGLILLANTVGIWQQQRRPIKPDFRAAAEYLANRAATPATILVQIPYLQHTLNYYYPRPYHLLEGLWTNDGKTEATVNREMTALTANISDLWLVLSEEELWDQRRLMRAWLNKNGQVVDEAHFMRVDIYHYRLKPGQITLPGCVARPALKRPPNGCGP